MVVLLVYALIGALVFVPTLNKSKNDFIKSKTENFTTMFQLNISSKYFYYVNLIALCLLWPFILFGQVKKYIR